jgi:hypothetical protein
VADRKISDFLLSQPKPAAKKLLYMVADGQAAGERLNPEAINQPNL